MQYIKIKFVDFWPTFNPVNNYFIKLLKRRFIVELSDEPDILIYSVFGWKHKKFDCFKIFWTGENIRPNFKQCDFAFTFDHLNRDDHYRLPLYALYMDSPDLLIKWNQDIDQIMREKTKFCNFVYSDKRGRKRNDFFERLSKYKKVDSPGRVKNNMGGALGGNSKDKLNFIKNYKFTIAFEVSSHPGYTTEKIVHPMLVNSLPIYWGNELVHLDFNPKSFLNYYDFPNEDALIERIIEIDQNDDLYRQYLLEPYYHNNKINSYIDPDNILQQFEKIIEHVEQTKTNQPKKSNLTFKLFGK